MQNLLVIGGNGFVGSAVCRQAISRGWKVTSISRSGLPYASAKGHQPGWSTKVCHIGSAAKLAGKTQLERDQVKWEAGSASDPETFARLLPESTAVVHTLGILLEGDYKSGGISSTLQAIAKRFFPSAVLDGPNPLAPESSHEGGQYEKVNRDSALSVFEAFRRAQSASQKYEIKPFVYISAEDIFRPLIPSRYIASKREAERRLDELAQSDISELPQAYVQPYFMRPSLIYHPHVRPISTLPAALLDLSASIQAKLPLPLQATTGSAAFKAFSALLGRTPAASRDRLPPFTDSMASLLTIPPIHVDTVGEAVCKVIERNETMAHDRLNYPVLDNTYGVKEMRTLVGFDKSNTETADSSVADPIASH